MSLYHCLRWEIRRSTLLKNARVGNIIFLPIHVLIFQSPSCPEAVHLSRWESLLVECHPLDDQIVRGPITANMAD
jgi:hypothetical protein